MAGMPPWAVLAQIVILLAGATLLGLAAQRLGQSAVSGYLLAGVLLAPYLLRGTGAAAVGLLAEIGVALLLFTIGLEFSPARLRALGWHVAALGLLQIAGTASAAAAGARAIGLSWRLAVLIGIAVAMSSTTVVLRLISERSELDSVHGRAALGVSLLQDLAVIPAMLLAALPAGAAGPLLLGAALVKAVGLLGAMYVLIRWAIPAVLMPAAGGRNRDLPVLLSTVVCLGASWAAHALELPAVLGAFAAGLLLSQCALADQIRADVIPLRAAFLPLFFASAGMLAGVSGWAGAGRMLGLVVALTVLKTLVVTLAGVALRLPPGGALRAGLMLAQIGEFSFVLLESARRSGLLEEALFRLLLSVSVTTLLLSPPLVGASGALASALEAVLRRRTGLAPVPLPEAAPVGRGHVLVIGYGPAGRQVAAHLTSRGLPVLVLDLNPRTLAEGGPSALIEYGDATQQEILERAAVQRARAVVVTAPDPLTARNIIAQVRRMAPQALVIVRARYHIHRDLLREAGADRLVSEEVLVGRELAAETLDALGEGA